MKIVIVVKHVIHKIEDVINFHHHNYQHNYGSYIANIGLFFSTTVKSKDMHPQYQGLGAKLMLVVIQNKVVTIVLHQDLDILHKECSIIISVICLYK